MEYGNRGRREIRSEFSRKQRAGRRRTYFFDLRRTRADDFYLVLTESTRHFGRDGGMERHKIFIYKEDINRFLDNLQDTVDYLKDELMPDYDFDEFNRRKQEERESYEAENSYYDDEEE